MKGYNRLAPEVEVRLMSAYFIACTGVVRTRPGASSSCGRSMTRPHAGHIERRPQGEGTINGCRPSTLPAEVRLFEPLFRQALPRGKWGELRQPERQLADGRRCAGGTKSGHSPTRRQFQFVRDGYFCVDPDTTADRLVFNRTVSLKDTWR